MKTEMTFSSRAEKSDITPHLKHYSQLLKGTLIDVAHDAVDDSYGLVFRMPNREVKTAWILRDEEGNGPGFAVIL